MIDVSDPQAMELWRTVARIADAIDGATTRWCLVGGLMVALFAIEAGQLQRPTTDIDILDDARQRPSGTQSVTLLSLMTDPRTAGAALKTTERRWLRSIEARLDIDDRRLEALFDPARLRIARAAYRRLAA